MNLKHIKPYLFILAIFVIPLAFIPLLKNVKNNYNTENRQTIEIKTEQNQSFPFAIAIHGGAGDITSESITKNDEIAYKTKLYEAIQNGISHLNDGDSAINVVLDVIKILEDSPLFNAGKGAVFTNEGKNELEASIMNGLNLQAGAVAGVTTIKNPILAANEVMNHSNHIMLIGIGAEQFAKTQGVEIVDSKYFFTEKRCESIQDEKKIAPKYGSVGCVVLDKYGNLAAGTSTGGITDKKNGRIGDVAIIGAATYADNNTCAVSCNGLGDYFIRYNVAYDIAARMKYLNESVNMASENVMHNLKMNNGFGGLICVDNKANISMPFNTKGMIRGYCKSGEEPQIFLY